MRVGQIHEIGKYHGINGISHLPTGYDSWQMISWSIGVLAIDINYHVEPGHIRVLFLIICDFGKKGLDLKLLGGLEHDLYFPIYFESSSQLTIIFFRGVGQPPTRYPSNPHFELVY